MRPAALADVTAWEDSAPETTEVIEGRSRLLILDTERTREERIRRVFPEPRWQLSWSRPDADEIFAADYIVVDICPEGKARVDLVSALVSRHPRAQVYAVTAYPSLAVAVAAIKAGARDCLAKPIDPAELRRVFEGATAPRLGRGRTVPSLSQMKWDYVAQVMDAVNGNISLAARTLGIQRSTLQRKLKKQPLR